MSKLTIKIGQKRNLQKEIHNLIQNIKKDAYIICSSLDKYNDYIDNEFCHFIFIDNELYKNTDDIIKDIKYQIDNDYSKDIIVTDIDIFNINYEYHVHLLSQFLSFFKDIYLVFHPIINNHSFPFSIFFKKTHQEFSVHERSGCAEMNW